MCKLTEIQLKYANHKHNRWCDNSQHRYCVYSCLKKKTDFKHCAALAQFPYVVWQGCYLLDIGKAV